MRSEDEKEKRQLSLKERLDEIRNPPDPEPWRTSPLRIREVAVELGISRETARRMFRNEDGAMLVPPGSLRPRLLVPREVLERVRRRISNHGGRQA